MKNHPAVHDTLGRSNNIAVTTQEVACPKPKAVQVSRSEQGAIERKVRFKINQRRRF